MNFNFLVNQINEIAAKYGVNPIIFGIVYVASVPVFYVAFYFVVRELVKMKRDIGKEKKKDTDLLTISALLLAISYMSPYAYVALFGKNLPLIFWIIFWVVITLSIYTLYKKVKKNINIKLRKDE